MLSNIFPILTHYKFYYVIPGFFILIKSFIYIRGLPTSALFQARESKNSAMKIRPWFFRIDYFENKRQNLSSHLELVILENSWFFKFVICQENWRNWLFSEITSSRWQDGNNRLQFSITCLDHQGHNFLKLTKKFILLFHISICWLCKKNIDLCLWTTSQWRMLDRCVLCNFANFLIPGLI